MQDVAKRTAVDQALELPHRTKQRLLNPVASTTPARLHASTARRASWRVSASGFSHHTCLPASAAATTWPTCTECGVARKTASTSGSAIASSNAVDSRNPCRAAKSRTVSGSLLTPWTTRIRPLRPWTASTIDLPHRPSPTTAALIIFTSPRSGEASAMATFHANPLQNLDQTTRRFPYQLGMGSIRQRYLMEQRLSGHSLHKAWWSLRQPGLDEAAQEGT
jgi:hypothetical protein